MWRELRNDAEMSKAPYAESVQRLEIVIRDAISGNGYELGYVEVNLNYAEQYTRQLGMHMRRKD